MPDKRLASPRQRAPLARLRLALALGGVAGAGATECACMSAWQAPPSNALSIPPNIANAGCSWHWTSLGPKSLCMAEPSSQACDYVLGDAPTSSGIVSCVPTSPPPLQNPERNACLAEHPLKFNDVLYYNCMVWKDATQSHELSELSMQYLTKESLEPRCVAAGGSIQGATTCGIAQMHADVSDDPSGMMALIAIRCCEGSEMASRLCEGGTLKLDGSLGVNCKYEAHMDGPSVYKFNSFEHDSQTCYEMNGFPQELSCMSAEHHLSMTDHVGNEGFVQYIKMQANSKCCEGTAPIEIPQHKKLCRDPARPLMHDYVASYECAPIYDPFYNMTCGGTPIMAWANHSHADETTTHTSHSSIEDCARTCFSHAECGGFNVVEEGVCSYRKLGEVHPMQVLNAGTTCYKKRGDAHEGLGREECTAHGGMELAVRCASMQSHLLRMDVMEEMAPTIEHYSRMCCGEEATRPQDPEEQQCQLQFLCGERGIQEPDLPAGMGCKEDHSGKLHGWGALKSTATDCAAFPGHHWGPIYCPELADFLADPDTRRYLPGDHCEVISYWSRVCCENLDTLGGGIVKGVEVSMVACGKKMDMPDATNATYGRRLQHSNVAAPWSPRAGRRLQGVNSSAMAMAYSHAGPSYVPPSPVMGLQANPARAKDLMHVRMNSPEMGVMDLDIDVRTVNGKYAFWGYMNKYPMYRNIRHSDIYLQWWDSHWGIVRSEPSLGVGHGHRLEASPWRPKAILAAGPLFVYQLFEVEGWPHEVQYLSCGHYLGITNISILPWSMQRPCLQLPREVLPENPVMCGGVMQ